MAKDKSEKKAEKLAKRASTGGVEKPEKADKKDKKEKKEKKEKRASKAAELVEAVNADAADVSAVADVSMADDSILKTEDAAVISADIPLAALVPFANPLCDEKATKKVLKTVKKAAKQKCLKRGVKEVVKAVRKTPAGQPSAALPNGIVVLAADISPMDVISHIPVLCEDHNIPYVFLTSRAELGAAGATKRPTSVVMVTPVGSKGQKGDAEWDEAFGDMHKLALKQGQRVKV